MSIDPVRGISSMATKHLLAELARDHEARRGTPVAFESVGGVEAARRVAAGEPFDLVALAAGALARLAAAGLVQAGSVRDFAVSQAALAVRAGAPHPAIGNRAELVATLQRARSIAVSTGPSGDALVALLQAAGILDEVRPRLVQAPPGVPVAAYVADGTAEIGVQQASELAGCEGIDVAGALPADAAIATTFAVAVGAQARRPDEARAFIDFIVSAPAAAAIRRAQMQPPAD